MKVDLTKRAHQAPPTVFITHCPVCGSELIKVEALHYCPNKNCKAKVIEAIIHFASRSAMDIDGLGEKIVETFYNEKLIKDVSDLYQLETKKAEILLLEGWQEKSYQNLITALEASKDKSLESLLFGLGIKEVGSKTAKVLALAFEDLDRLMIASEEELFNIKDIGTTTVKALHDYFLDQENVKLIMRLKEAGLNMKYLGPKVVTDSFFSGKTVVITGTLEHYSRESLSNILENLGAKVSSAVSKHTDFLIVGSEAGSKLSKAKTLGTRIILEPELREILAE
ncbi:MAG: NAD-dependent DNA ligase LigA, partial [Erysipelotrichaceae bacterium]|jgi:DNA ligase (NAD+)|nr:NAD-dependent DNA ligase LigA [Erysipelotrichaceae bacterium]